MQSVTIDNCITYEEMLEMEASHDKFLESQLDPDIQDEVVQGNNITKYLKEAQV